MFHAASLFWICPFSDGLKSMRLKRMQNIFGHYPLFLDIFLVPIILSACRSRPGQRHCRDSVARRFKKKLWRSSNPASRFRSGECIYECRGIAVAKVAERGTHIHSSLFYNYSCGHYFSVSVIQELFESRQFLIHAPSQWLNAWESPLRWLRF